jgi:hypothetical protein
MEYEATLNGGHTSSAKLARRGDFEVCRVKSGNMFRGA